MKLIKIFPKITFRYLSFLIIIFFVYTFAGKLGLSFAFLNASVSAIWPPSGFAFAMLLLFGYRVLPAIFLGAFIVNLTTQGTIATSLGIALGNTMEGLVAVYLVTRFAHGKQAFEHVVDVLKFSVAGILSTMVGATIGVTTLFLGGLVLPQHIGPVWTTWLLGDLGGMLLIGPFVFLWLSKFSLAVRLRHTLFYLLFLLFVVGSSEIIFSGIFPYPYLCIPLLVMGAFRFNQKEEAGALFILTLIATWNTVHGIGPYATAQMIHGINDSLLLLQMFLSTCAMTTFVVTAAILERKQTKTALATTEERFKALIEKSSDAVVLIDPTSRITYASPSALNVLGYTPEELQGKIGFDLVLPEDRALTIRELAKLSLQPGGTLTVEYRTIKKDGTIIWVEATGTNLLFDPNISAIVVNFHDISERKISEEKLTKEKEEDEAMIASIGEGIIATDETGKIALVNEAACDMLHAKRKDLIGQNVIDIIQMQDRAGKSVPQSQRPMTKVLLLGKSVVSSPENYYVRLNGTKFPVQFTLTPILLKKKVVGTVEVFRDITQEMAIDKAKTEFVSLASHQLRTPLATINWYLERLLDEEIGRLKPDQHRYLDEVYHASKRMVDLINTLLNVSRLDLGTFVVEPEDISLSTMISSLLEEFKHQIESKKLIITKSFDKKLPVVKADPKLLQIIMQNILGNAIQYSNTIGKIHIKISFDTKEYIMSVSDSGIGIPQKDQNKIFTKMFRSDNAKVHDPSGNGLGMYLVKTIVDKTGGKIWFESTEGKGTSFFVSFPMSGMKKKTGSKQLR